MAQWIKKWQVAGSSGSTYTVSADIDGNYGCSCPVWKFRREQCKHIDEVKNNLIINAGIPGNKNAQAGNVGEVTIKRDVVLYPLAPIGCVDIMATIVYDMQRAGVRRDIIQDYKDRMLGKKVSYKAIQEHVEYKGRYVYQRWEKGRGWISPAFVKYNTPLKKI